MFKEANKANDGEPSPTLFHEANGYLYDKIDGVFTKKERENYQTLNALKRNASTFSAYKTAHFTEHLKGKTKEQRTAILNTYERQLRVEGTLAVRTSRAAKQWAEIQRKKHVYPNLEYLPSRSAIKRPEHEILYGTIKPVDDPFWSQYYPPNGWNCKCRVQSTRKDSTGSPNNLPPVPKGIPGNAGMEAKIFSDDNSFQKNTTPQGRKRILKHLEQYKKDIPFGKPNFSFKNGGEITVHPFADVGDLESNVKYAKVLVENQGGKLEIMPHGEGKNPEYRYNGVVGDRTEFNGTNVISYIKNTFISKIGTKGQLKKYDKNFIAMDLLGKLNDENLVQLARKINGELNMPNKNTSLQFLIIKNDSKTLIINKGERYETILKKAKELL